MDEFEFGPPSLNGTFLSMEFGTGGRIQNLWVSDPNQPEGEEFQFVCSPINMGDEVAEDYFPGTVLLGARSHPDDPWVLSRNSKAAAREQEDDRRVTFDYEFAFLEELHAEGHFFEASVPLPHVVWELTLRNNSRRSIEIGELGLPMALNTVYEGFPDQERDDELWQNRVFLHKFIGGAGSHAYAQRLGAKPPGLLIFPGENTHWEFYNHVPASIRTPYRWEGIPVFYIHSRAAIEREGWGEWFVGHTSLILEPGETRRYETRFLPATREAGDTVALALAGCERPAMRLFPGAVSTVEAGIGVEVGGCTPTRFWTDVPCQTETDSDDEGGYCFVKPNAPGAVKLSFEDTKGRQTQAHLLFVDSIDSLIQRRAAWIETVQVIREPKDPLCGAIFPADTAQGTLLEPYGSEDAILCSLTDGAFLATKNSRYPVRGEITSLDAFLERFVEQRLRNPGDGSVGAMIPNSRSVAVNYGESLPYLLTIQVYRAMAEVAKTYGAARLPGAYLGNALQTALALFRRCSLPTSGLPLMADLWDLAQEAEAAGIEQTDELRKRLAQRAYLLLRRKFPYHDLREWASLGYEEPYRAALEIGEIEAAERALRCAQCARSLSPSWWWNGSDKAWGPGGDPLSQQAIPDGGEMCLGPGVASNSVMFLRGLDRDTRVPSETQLRMAYGGMLAVWALVRADGASGTCFCPDPASKQFGMSWFTGTAGINLFRYVRDVQALVVPHPAGVSAFGCHFEARQSEAGDQYSARIWDGVGRRLSLRQIDLEISTSFGKIEEATVGASKTELSVKLTNPADRPMTCEMHVRGLWGRRVLAEGSRIPVQNGVASVSVKMPQAGNRNVHLKVEQ